MSLLNGFLDRLVEFSRLLYEFDCMNLKLIFYYTLTNVFKFSNKHYKIFTEPQTQIFDGKETKY